MKYIRFGSLALVASIAVGSAPLPAQPELPANKWIVDWGEQRCSLVRRSGGAEPVTMVLRASLGAYRPELALSKEAKPLPWTGADVDVMLEPAALPMSAFSQPLRSKGGERILSVSNLPEDFFDRFAGSRAVVVQRKGQELIRLEYGPASAAIRNLKACNDDLLASWGVDPKLMSSLQRRPKPTDSLGAWFSDGDYPEEAIRARESGSVVVRITIGTDGRVGECVPVVSSGSTRLDKQTCRSLTSRGRYEPALAPDGKPVAVESVETVHWVLPQ